MDFPLYTTLKMSLFHFFFLNSLLFSFPRKTVISPLLATFPKALTWEVKDRDWEGAIREPECQGRQKSLEGRGVGILGEKNLFVALPSEDVDSVGGGCLRIVPSLPRSPFQWGECQGRNRKDRNFKT